MALLYGGKTLHERDANIPGTVTGRQRGGIIDGGVDRRVGKEFVCGFEYALRAAILIQPAVNESDFQTEVSVQPRSGPTVSITKDKRQHKSWKTGVRVAAKSR